MLKYIAIGRILKPYRNDGTLIALTDPGLRKDMENARAIFIRLRGQAVPYFIESLDFDKDLAYIKFEEFNGPEDVKPYNGSELMMMESDIKNYTKKQDIGFTYSDLVGFSLLDNNSGLNAKIISVEQFPQQLMAIAEYNDNNIYIPLVDVFIKSVDPVKKEIIMELPDGIFSL